MSKYFNRGRYDGADSPDEMEAHQLRRSLFEAAGLEPPDFEDESNAPAITAELRRDLLALARRELTGKEEWRVLSLVARFQSIAVLFAELSAADYRGGNN